MANDAIINMGSKYLIICSEDTFGAEKWKNFENPDSTTPPIGAVHGEDFIIVGAAGDSMASNSSDVSYYEDDMTGFKYPNDSIQSADPKVNMIGSFDDLKFILSRFMDSTNVSIIPPGGAVPIDTTLLSANLSPNVLSNTLYAGVYTDKESSVTGCQLDELSATFNKTDGVIPIELSFYGSKFKLGELKPQGVLNNLRTPPIESWNADSVWLNINDDDTDNVFVENSDKWQQIGCDVSELNLSIKNNLDTDSGATICSAFSSVNDMSGFTNLNRFRGKLSSSDTPEITAELTKKQNTAFFKMLQLGGPGAVEQLDSDTFKLKIVFYNVRGEVLVLGFAGVNVNTDSPSLTNDAEEKVSMNAIVPGSFKLNSGGGILSSGLLFAHFYPESFYSTQGIGFAQLLTGPNSDNDYTKSRIIIQRVDDGNIVSLLDLTQDDFSNQGGIIKNKLKMYRGEYEIFLRTKADPATKTSLGTFTVDENSTLTTPFCLNSLADVSSKFGYADCVTTVAVEENLSPDPIDVEDSIEHGSFKP